MQTDNQVQTGGQGGSLGTREGGPTASSAADTLLSGFRLQNHEKILVYCLSHPGCGPWLQRPKLAG